MAADGVQRSGRERRFLLVASFPDSIIRFRGALIDALASTGLQVHVAAPGLTANSGVVSQLQRKGVHCHDIPLARTGINPLQDTRTLMSLVRVMWQVRPQYVMGYTIKPVVYGVLAAWLTRVPRRFALITGLGHAFQADAQGTVLQRLVRLLYRGALARADKVFFQNPDDEALFRSLGILGRRVPSQVVNGSGVDVEQFAMVTLPSSPLRFLLIARLISDKGIREYVAAAQIVHKQHPNVRFLLVGWIDDGPTAIAQSELNEWVASGTIEYLGRMGDVRTAISDASVYVLPSSYREGTPRTVLEAMAMGRPIITTDAPGCRETVVEGGNGYLVPIKDAQTLARTMLRFVERPDTVAVMGAYSRRIAEQKYDVHKVNIAMLEGMGIC